MAEETTTTTTETKSDGLSRADRDAAEVRRKAAEAELEARIAATATGTIKKLEDQLQAALASRDTQGPSPALERRIADLEAKLQVSETAQKALQDRADRKTIDADARAVLGKAKVLDGDAALRYLRDDLRVDDDGKVAVRLQDGADQWGSLTEENLSKRLPAIFFAPKGSPGAGSQGSREEAKTPDIVEAGKRSQKEFNKNFDEIKAAVKATEEPIGG